MILSSLFIGLFPKVLPRKLAKVQQKINRDDKSHHFEEETPLRALSKISEDNEEAADKEDTFALALTRLVKNKLLMFNTIGSVFYILGSSVFMTYFSKYLEVQFNKNAAESSLMTGPVTIVSMVTGIMLSGYCISKYQPPPKILFFFNVIVGFLYMCTQLSNIFVYCEAGNFYNETGLVNLTTVCNMDCSCTGVPYSPVCDEATGVTFFSPCHAGCKGWSDSERRYTQCECAKSVSEFTNLPYSLPTSVLKAAEAASIRTRTQFEGTTVEPDYDLYNEDDYDDDQTTTEQSIRKKRSSETSTFSMIPGLCLASCGYAYFTYTLISCVVNFLGSAARIGNLLVNFRWAYCY